MMCEKCERYKHEITRLNCALRLKNIALDSMAWVWCSGGCDGGIYRWQELWDRFHKNRVPLTDEMMSTIEQNTIRLRSWLEGHKCREARKNNCKMDKCHDCTASCFKPDDLGD